MTCVRTTVGDIEFFPIRIGFHLVSSLSPYIYALTTDEVSHEMQGEVPWCILLTTILFWFAKTMIEFNIRLDT